MHLQLTMIQKDTDEDFDIGPPGNGDLSTDGALPAVCPWKPLHSLNSTLAESCTVLSVCMACILACLSMQGIDSSYSTQTCARTEHTCFLLLRTLVRVLQIFLGSKACVSTSF